MGKVITYGSTIFIEGMLQSNLDSNEKYKPDTRTDWTDTTINEIVVGLKSGKGGCLVCLFVLFFFFFSSFHFPLLRFL